MRMFDVQGIEILATCPKVFEFVKEPANLPRWTHAFVSRRRGSRPHRGATWSGRCRVARVG
jgi:hypothetical protein